MSDLSLRGTAARTVERRSTAFRDVELRAAADGTGGETLRFSGYASVTESPYEMEDWLGSYTEIVRHGAFAKTLSEGADVPLKVNHDGIALARTKSGTLRLAEDSTGLHVEADLDARSPAVATLRSAMERRDLDEMSFAFIVTRQTWSPDYMERSIAEVNLNKGDVSVVNFGANPATAGATLDARALAGRLAQLPDEQRREVYERLAAELVEQPTPAAAAAVPLSVYAARARLLAL
jgi:HK97 family phage prohead protease